MQAPAHFRQRVFVIIAAYCLTAPPSSVAQESVQLRNAGGGDGTLEIWPDAYGALSFWGWSLNFDRYDPLGVLGPGGGVFAANVMIYDPVLQDRLALAAEGRDIHGLYNPTATLDKQVLEPLVAFDTDGDGLDDTATSRFSVSGNSGSGDPSLRLVFDLEQSVSGPIDGVATFAKVYQITNVGPNPVSIQLEQHDDFDLGWDGDLGEPAGADSNGGFRNAYMREPDEFPGHLTTAVALSGSAGGFYSAGRTTDPNCGEPDPPYSFGTDFTQWDRYGMPDSWRNHTAHIGYDVDGIEGRRQPPCGPPGDGQLNLMWELDIEPACTVEVTIVHTYGATTPAEPISLVPFCGEPHPCDTNCDGAIDALDIEPFLDLLFGPYPRPCSVGAGDTNGDGVVNALDIEPFLDCLFP